MKSQDLIKIPTTLWSIVEGEYEYRIINGVEKTFP